MRELLRLAYPRAKLLLTIIVALLASGWTPTLQVSSTCLRQDEERPGSRPRTEVQRQRPDGIGQSEAGHLLERAARPADDGPIEVNTAESS